MGYKDRTVLLEFPELVDDGDECWVRIRNPKLMPPSMLMPDDVPTSPDGQPVDVKAAEQATYAMMAKMVQSWHVWDATDDSDEPPLLGDPTPEAFAKLPVEIVMRITGEIADAVPSPPTP